MELFYCFSYAHSDDIYYFLIECAENGNCIFSNYQNVLSFKLTRFIWIFTSLIDGDCEFNDAKCVVYDLEIIEVFPHL